ncbi:FxsA family protein [Devosia sp.]|uniref:FxsA family protein n=1 Tax=Devosia sp. TaxID=1871048 RepID=UPI002F0B489E
MGRLLLALFLAVPLIEIALFVVIGRAIGLWPTLLGVVVTALAGALLLRVQGLALWTQMQDSLNRGTLPARALADAMMVTLAALLLLTPGYFTDAMGLLLLLPPVRSLVYAALKRRLRVVAVAPTAPGWHADPRVQDSGTIDLDDGDWRRH